VINAARTVWNFQKPVLGTTVFRGKFFQIPRAHLPNSAANFPHLVINLLQP